MAEEARAKRTEEQVEEEVTNYEKFTRRLAEVQQMLDVEQVERQARKQNRPRKKRRVPVEIPRANGAARSSIHEVRPTPTVAVDLGLAPNPPNRTILNLSGIPNFTGQSL
jgi:cytochrome c-type biogenesis protein CcmH/NrfG